MKKDEIKFKASCLKKLSAVEADPNRSNQHELNGIAELKKIFGPTGFTRMATFFLDGTDVQNAAEVTWYEAREAHPTRSEYRLYFKTNAVMAQAAEGDSILVGVNEADQLYLVLQKSAIT